ncbi:MAG TPA: hypothetical protein VFA34_12375 [Actinomycetota bacterium]|jgi:hypothetical protein|nr:hypothetical protein [Actinomycetota bacterium]
MTDYVESLTAIQSSIDKALETTEADKAASPVLLAVVREFAKKAGKAIKFAGDGKGWEATIELEQAGDSAKYAVEADEGVAESTRKAVLDAHLAICVYKAEQDKARSS